MTKEEQQEKLLQLDHEIDVALDEARKKANGIIDRYFSGETNVLGERVGRIEKVLALFDLTNLSLIDAVSTIESIREKQEDFIKVMNVPVDSETEDMLESLLEIRNHIHEIIKNYLARDTRKIYSLYSYAWNEKDVNMYGNPLCATEFFNISRAKMVEMEKIKEEVTSD